MNKLTIPVILAATVMVAGMFAFMPVQQASTVHTTVQASTTQIVETEFLETNSADQNIRIQCPSGSDGCQILEVYVEETAGSQVEFDNIDFNIDGDTIANAVDINPDDQATSQRIIITEAGGIALGNSDWIELDTDADNTNNAARYTVKVIGFIEGDTDNFTISFQ